MRVAQAHGVSAQDWTNEEIYRKVEEVESGKRKNFFDFLDFAVILSVSLARTHGIYAHNSGREMIVRELRE
jgi:hypothetical protein